MWQPCTEERYDYMMGVLPPALMHHGGFLVGEPFHHRTCRITGRISPTYAAFIRYKGKCYEGGNMTAG